MILFINTVDAAASSVALVEKSNVIAKKNIVAVHHRSEHLLGEIERLLKLRSVSLKSISGIVAVAGPGSFTSLRIGVTLANTLAWLLRIRIAGVTAAALNQKNALGSIITSTFTLHAKHGIIEPVYGKQPNITIKKN